MNEEQLFKCDLCNEAEFDNLQKLNVHKVHCRKKTGKLERTERVPFGVPVKRFNAPEEDGYVYRVFNDNWRKEPGRIERARMAGYETVPHERSGEAVGTNEDGSEITGVLMRIPKELYDEDQAQIRGIARVGTRKRTPRLADHRSPPPVPHRRLSA